jgi:hypothetical protein
MEIFPPRDKRRFLPLIVDMLKDCLAGKFGSPGMETRFGKPALTRAKEGFLKTLRRFVDQWIDSGKTYQDTDSPHNRDLSRTVPGYETPLFDTLADWLHHHPPTMLLLRSGVVGISDRVRFNHDDLDAYALDLAFYYFLVLLELPDRERLFRCDGCKTYLARARSPKKGIPIYHGTFCKNCKGKGGVRRTLAIREKRKQEIIGVAADYWLKSEEHRSFTRAKSAGIQADPERAKHKWIATQVNRELTRRNRDHITGKWVTQNRIAILKELERRNHATS